MNYSSPTRRVRAAAFAALAALAGLAVPAYAQLSIGTSASLGRLDYEIESDAQQNWSGSAKVISLGADVALPDGYYAGLSHTFTNSGELDFSFRGALGNSSKFKRRDTALTFGAALDGKLGTFGGLRTGSTDIANPIDTQFKTTGVFVGLAYPLSFGPSQLSLSFGFGVNRGTWSDTTGPSASDTAFGYSGGLKYGYAFTPRVSATAGLKLQRYAYDFTSQGFGTLDEDVRTFELGVSVGF